MCDNPACAGLGCPIRTPPDQSLLGGSPRLIAACYVLHRSSKSRHPPCALVTAFHCYPRNCVSCETQTFRTYGCRSDHSCPIDVASPTLFCCVPHSPCFRLGHRRIRNQVVKMPLCGNGDLREKTPRLGASKNRKNSERERKEEAFPLCTKLIIADHATLSSVPSPLPKTRQRGYAGRVFPERETLPISLHR